MKKYHIGTSGMHYSHWYGNFYKTKTDLRGQYMKHFNFHEINTTFYGTVNETFIKKWNNALKKYNKNFIFSVKLNKYITHNKKLAFDCEKHFNIFFDSIRKLKNCHFIVAQFPKNFHPTEQNLEKMKQLTYLPEKYKYIFEFRNEKWNDDNELITKYKKLFRQNSWTRAFTDHKNEYIWNTSNILYFRLHGPEHKYTGSYSSKKLHDLLTLTNNKNIKTVIFAMDNTDDQIHNLPSAVYDAKRLIKKLNLNII